MLEKQFDHLDKVRIVDLERDFYKKREFAGLRGEELIFGTYDLLEHVQEEHPDCLFHFVMGGSLLTIYFLDDYCIIH